MQGDSACAKLQETAKTPSEFLGVSFTCDVVEVVEAVEVQAAGLPVGRVRALPAHRGRPEGVRHPHSAVGSGAGLYRGGKTIIIIIPHQKITSL